MPMAQLSPPVDAILLALPTNIYWRDLPILIVTVSVVYGATRYDQWDHILREAIRWILRLATFLVAVMLILYVLARLFN
jgi:hypothetical protein